MTTKFISAAVAVSLLAVSIPSNAQLKTGVSKKGGISEKMLTELQESYKNTPSDKAVKNALAKTSIQVLAFNAENAAMIDTHFSDRVKNIGITDQQSSGRCWLFTGLNVLRSQMINEFELPGLVLSQNYLFFYDQLEKANLFLQGVIDTRKLSFDNREVDWLFSHPISDGGNFTGVSDLCEKYGVVPASAMPETYTSNNTSHLSRLLSLKLREFGLQLRDAKEKDLQNLKTDMLKEVYRMLTLAFGVPPTEFEWTRENKDGEIVNTRTYTPKSFYDEYLGNKLNDNYVMLMNDPSREYYKVYEIQYDRHVYDGHNWLYLNLPVEKIKEMAIASIKDNVAMYFSCDVGKFMDTKKGTLDLRNYDYESLMGVDFGMDKKQRIITHASGSSHAMTLVAVDVEEDGTTSKWMVENSWGESNGWKGHLIMTDEWFNEYMFRLVVEKKYVPSDVMELLNQKPIMLPAWDPMFAEEN